MMTKTPTMMRKQQQQRLRRIAFTHKILYVAAAATFSTSTTAEAWLLNDIDGHRRTCYHVMHFAQSQPQQQQRRRRRYASLSSSSSTVLLATPNIMTIPLLSSLSSSASLSLLGVTTRTTASASASINHHYGFIRYITSTSRKGKNTTHLYSSSPNNNNGLFGFRKAVKKIVRKVARKILPTKWFGTKEEKLAIERKKRVQNEVQGQLGDLLKNAPLPIRLFGKYIAAPLMGKIASKLAEGMERQRETMEKIVDDTRSYLLNDNEIADLLGMPMQLGTPIAQSSVSASMNGRKQNRMELSLEVSGPKTNGIVRIVATEEGIGQLLVEADGKLYNVDLASSKGGGKKITGMKGGRSSKSIRHWNNDEGEVIDAEIVDKTERR
mmetsp:Transcript_30670/g.34436  ORF Transcript_30670/g.34436 Transcript_30670/m.34436 type:complete len:381 (-) Transcript_30670:39-1181(-)